ncbi:histidine kinase [Synergistaceae bacterium OttesenSCG-928-I11]|nr:histidine kinase [Synergistaceae bacterium OttesenSCG-928-I11]
MNNLFAPGSGYIVTNIVLELFCAAVTFVLALHLSLSWNRHTRNNRLFAAILLLHTLMLLCDAMAWFTAMDSMPSRGMNLLSRVVNFSEFSISFVNLILMAEYIVSSFSQKRAIPRRIVHIVAVVCLSCIALLVVSQWNGIVYRVDEYNRYLAGPLYDAVLITGTAIMFFIGLSVIYYFRSISRGDAMGFVSYLVFLLLSSLLQLVYPDLMVAYATVTLSLLIIYVNVHVQQDRRLREREIELKDKEIELADARIAAMISQIQPHFLYNALSVVGDLCAHDPKEARNAIVEFSRYLRANLSGMTQKKLIPFEEELGHVDTYLALEARRFDDRLKVEYRIGPRNFFLPPLTVQPIVENAVRHGVTVRAQGGTVVVATEEGADVWRVRVSDDGVGFDPTGPGRDERPHVGIENARFRIENLCDGRLEIESAPGRGTTVVIEIPKHAVPDA